MSFHQNNIVTPAWSAFAAMNSMVSCFRPWLGLLAVMLLSAGCAAPSGQTPSTDDAGFAANLWQSLTAARLAGPEAIRSKPYLGQSPHGVVLEWLDARLTVEDQTGPVLVKRNYAGTEISIDQVARDPARYLQAVTVMYRRPGYDPANNDWFWVRYQPSGELAVAEGGQLLAGRLNRDCIVCHTVAPGGDLVFTHDRYAR